jgi:ATP-dependent RNA helicase DeaD
MSTEDLSEQLDKEATVLFEPENTLPDFEFSQLPAWLKARVDAMGWKNPTPVQRKSIPYQLDGRDMIVQARTGSGKTAGYLLPMLERVHPEHDWCQGLILVPTRELARQVHVVLRDLTEGSDIRSAVVYGGTRYGQQIKDLKAGSHIVVGTPGRILDHIYRGTFAVQRVNTLVLDEADEMLSMGFYPSMRKLRRQLPDKRQTHLFSATIPYHVEQLAHEFLHNPDRLSLSRGNQTVSSLDHVYYIAPALQKDRVLMKLIEMENPESALIFTNTKRSAEYLSTVLKNFNIDAQHLTGDVPQNKRERLMESLRAGSLRFLIATDVAARGIDISDLSHVFLYDIPEHTEVYVHRSGRTARAGKTGVAITLCEGIEERKLLAIAKQYNFEIEKRELPSDEQVRERVSERLYAYLETKLTGLSLSDRERLEPFIPIAQDMATDPDMTRLLAMLLDHAYNQGLHAQLYEAEPASKREQPPQGDGGKSRPQRRRGGKNRGDKSEKGSKE